MIPQLPRRLDVLAADRVFGARLRPAIPHELGAMLVRLGRNEEAIGPLEESLKLRTEMLGAESRLAGEVER